MWFGCYCAVLTGDNFTALFGTILPSLSLLLVMVLRLVPNFTRKAKQLLDARSAIGMGADAGTIRRRAASGLTVLSGLATWALEGSITTADSMRSRGYGVGKRTNFQMYRMTLRDYVMLAVTVIFVATIIVCSAMGGTQAEFIPVYSAAPLAGFSAFGYVCYCIFLLIPSILYGKEAIQWQILKSGI